MLNDTQTGRQVYENPPLPPAQSTGATPGTTGQIDLLPPAPPVNPHEVPWPIPEPFGEVHLGELTSADNTLPLPSDHPGSTSSQIRRRATVYQCQAGEQLSVDLWAEFDCIVYLVGPNNEVIAANNTTDLRENHSRLENVAIPSAGNYRVIVTTYEPKTGGNFWISVGSQR